MDNYEQKSNQLLEAYSYIKENKINMPDWAVHKRNSDEIVTPTIPFLGKKYAQQQTKILIYASAENLSAYWKGNDRHWVGDWLDNDAYAINRHRNCFDNIEIQSNRQQQKKLPYVHCGPMEDGGLLIAAMYLASKLRNGIIEEPYSFYETIAFGNYGKFSIETELQHTIRNNPHLSYKEKLGLKKELGHCNIDTATMLEYLKISHDYIKADIEILKPDYIIMPKMDDEGFIDSVKGNAKIIRINQMNGTVINNIAPNQRNHHRSKYSQRNVNELPIAIKNAYNYICGINSDNYRYIFDHLDEELERVENKY